MDPAEVWREAASVVEDLAAQEAADGAPDSRTRAGALFSAAKILAGRAASPAPIQPPAPVYLRDLTPEVEVVPGVEAVRPELRDDDPTDPGVSGPPAPVAARTPGQ
jgi:hypothetical protein